MRTNHRRNFWAAGLLLLPALLAGVRGQDLDRTALLALAADGSAAQAWKVWTAQPASVEHFRIGIALASATGDLTRGVVIYRNLGDFTGKTDVQAATDLALGAADLLADSLDPMTRLAACATLVSTKRTRGGCADLIRTAKGTDADQQARIVYRLANSGVRPATPTPFDTRSISAPASVEIAQTMTRLAVADRVALLLRAFEDPDLASQRAAVSLLGDIRAPETLIALRNLQQRSDLAPELKTPVLVALARRGDQAALATIARLLPTMGRDARDAVTALAVAGNRAGLTPDRILETTEGPDRLRAAERFYETAPEAATKAIFEAIESLDPSLQQNGLRSAGAIGLGAESTVVACLTDRDEGVRSAAIDAVMQTRERALRATSAR